MQTCTKCNALSTDQETYCSNCGADLREFSSTAVALRKFQTNSRVRHIILAIHDDSCPACINFQGAYAKEDAPKLPIEGCSHEEGCRCFYQPVLNEIYP